MTENQLNTFGKRTALKLSLIISMILICIMFFSLIYARSRDLTLGLHVLNIFFSFKSVSAFFFNTLLLYCLFRFQFWIINKPKKTSKKGGLITFAGSLLFALILSPLFAQIQWRLLKEPVPLNLYLTIHFVKDMTVLVITFLFTSLLYMWDQHRKTLIENQKLSMESLQHRYEALRNQVEPHFLFNSLNTLNGLIGYDDDKAHEYVEELSSVFRYTMQSKKIISLEEELNFVQSYIYLMKIRYDDALQVTFQTDDKCLGYYILPFGLQLLVENAIKHNVISKKYPLSIIIETTDSDNLKVKNSVRLKPESPNSGIGLANLNERYRLIFNEEIGISRNETFFTVEIPLIKEIEHPKTNSGISYESCHC